MLIFVSEKKWAEVEMVVKEEVMEEREIQKVIIPIPLHGSTPSEDGASSYHVEFVVVM